MRKDPKEFRERFLRWKAGELVYKDGLPAYKDGKEPGKINWSRWDDAELTSYPVPFIDEKRITLTNAGRATGAVLSTNLLDSIADNANRAGLPLLTALGLAVKESTLGNPTDDRSAWNLSSGIRQAFNNKYPGTELHINYWGDALNEREDVINYHKGHQSDDPNSKGKSVLQEAFEFYRLYPDKYNPGQPGYLTAVNKRGEEVMQSPEIKRWKNARDTKKIVRPWTKPNLLLKESKFNLPKYAEGTEGDDWYKYVQAGKNNEWSRITNDDMSLAFLDLVVRPLSRGGNTTVGNWKRQWSPKYEKPLEIASPEFDIISGVRGITNILNPKKLLLKSVNDVKLHVDIAKEPYTAYIKSSKTTSADIAKESSTVRDIYKHNKLISNGNDSQNYITRAYSQIKEFLESPQYRKRIENYYKNKGSSYVTINNAPDQRIGELLYNIETTKTAIRPRGEIIDEVGNIKDSYGLYDPNSHSIQIAADALLRLTPEHEMWHAARRARAYLDNNKYKMRVKSTSLDPEYYENIAEQEVRVLDTLREMQKSGLDINSLTDDLIWNFIHETPIDMHGTNVQSLIDNYWYDDIKTALRNFKSVVYPLGFGGIGYGTYKNTQNELRNK